MESSIAEFLERQLALNRSCCQQQGEFDAAVLLLNLVGAKSCSLVFLSFFA